MSTVGGDLTKQGVKDGSPVAWALFIIMGAIILVWLGSASSPLNTFPAFGHSCASNAPTNICGLQTAFAQFSKVSVVTGIMTLVIPLAFVMMGEWLWKNRSREELEAEAYEIAGEPATYLGQMRRFGAKYRERARALRTYTKAKSELAAARAKEHTALARGDEKAAKHEKFRREKAERRVKNMEKNR